MKTLLSSGRFLGVSTLMLVGAGVLIGHSYLIAVAQACSLR